MLLQQAPQVQEKAHGLQSLGLGEDHPLPKPPYLHIHDLEIDTVGQRVRRSGRFVSLRPHEYALLELLALHSGQIVTRAQIKDQLYHHDLRRSNVIDAHICYLRNKIDRGFSLPLILTRWGEGYLLRGEERPAYSARETVAMDQ